MIRNAVETFSQEVSLFLSDEDEEDHRRTLLFPIQHRGNLKIIGDFSFPNTIEFWLKNIKDPDVSKNKTVLSLIGKTQSELIEKSLKWSFKIERYVENKGRACLFLNRPLAIFTGLSEALSNSQKLSRRLEMPCSGVYTDESWTPASRLTTMRVKRVSEVIENLLAVCECPPIKVFVTSRSLNKDIDRDMKVFLCGAVLNTNTKSKEREITSEAFVKIRQAELTLIAAHKYGVRTTTDSKWKEFLISLGESVASFELLQAKPSAVVKINFKTSQAGASRGAGFILYNCARLETIIKNFNEKVAEGVYPPLPDLNDIDFTLLNQEEEWSLVFSYLLGFPTMLAKCGRVSEECCDLRPHHVCSFLSAMVRVVSQYYRKTRILVEPRPHLLPTIFARIYLLKGLNETMKICLKILNINSVSQM